MCHDYTGDHEIQADAEAEWIEFQRQRAIEAQEDARESYKKALEDHNKPDFSDEELEAMNRVWQEAMRGCVGGN